MQTTIYEAHLSDYCQTPLIVEGVGEKNKSIFYFFMILFTFVFWILSNLAKHSYGWLRLKQHHKIGTKH
jgi:hypothetical protein